MPALKLPIKARSITAPFVERNVPGPEDFVVLSEPLQNATARVATLLQDCPSKWALAGDAAELVSGVSVRADHLTILTTTKGCGEITERLHQYLVRAPQDTEKKLDREAIVDTKSYQVHIKSIAAQFEIEKSMLDVHGDLRIKVGEWDWGDPLDYEPDYVYVGYERVPVVPLSLKTELYMGLGWMDRVKKIKEAMVRRHHGFG
jgi:hypothetical protein